MQGKRDVQRDGVAGQDQELEAAERAHPLVKKLFYALCDGPRADAVLVFRRTVGFNPVEFDVEGQAHAVATLREVFPTGSGVSTTAYRKRLSAAADSPHPMPSVERIEEVFGSWSAALAEAFPEPTRDVGATRLLASCKPTDEDALLKTIGVWARRERRQLYRQYFLEFCADEAAKGNPQRLFLVEGKHFDRRWGWLSLLKRLGLLSRRLKTAEQVEAERASASGTDVEPDPSDHRIRHYLAMLEGAGPLRRRFTEAHLHGALGLAVVSLGSELSEYDYADWADNALHGWLGQRVARLPSVKAFKGRWKTWVGALLANGFIDLATAIHRTRPREYSDDRLALAGARAFRDLGGRVTRSGYERWRDELHSQLTADTLVEQEPSDATLRNRLGGPNRRLEVAIAAAVERFPDVAHPPMEP